MLASPDSTESARDLSLDLSFFFFGFPSDVGSEATLEESGFDSSSTLWLEGVEGFMVRACMEIKTIGSSKANNIIVACLGYKLRVEGK